MPQSNETNRPCVTPSTDRQPASGSEIRSVTTSVAYVRAGERALLRIREQKDSTGSSASEARR
jgi:hypothetical protein